MIYNLFVRTDDEGNITETLALADGIPTEEFYFVFQVDGSIITKTHLYKVEIIKFKPTLVLRDDLPVEEPTETPTETSTEPSN